MILIYALADPSTGRVRYIGLTRNIRRRLRQHRLAKSSNKHLNHWMKLVQYPIVIELFICDTEYMADKLERYFITQFRRTHLDLINIANGGEGGQNMSEETKKKLSQIRRSQPKRILSQKHRDNISKALKGRPNPNPKGFVALNKSRTGIPLTVEHRANISKAVKGRKYSPEIKEKYRQAALRREAKKREARMAISES